MMYMLYNPDDDLLATSFDDTMMRAALATMVDVGLMDAADIDLTLRLVADLTRPGIWMVFTRPDVCRTMERLVGRRVVRLRDAEVAESPDDEMCFCVDLRDTPPDDIGLVQGRIARDFAMPLAVLERNWRTGGILVPADSGIVVMVPEVR